VEAVPLYLRLLAIDHENSVDPDMEDREILRVLAKKLRDKGETTEFEKIYRALIAVVEDDDPQLPGALPTDLTELAEFFRATKRLTQAEPFYREAVKRWKEDYIHDDNNLALGRFKLADCLRDLKKPTEAEPLYRSALWIFGSRTRKSTEFEQS
jgi:tetratricopeptide (TPR) repeat protein